MALSEETCVPCKAGAPLATAEEKQEYSETVPDWQTREVDGIERLYRVFKFKNFEQALAFTVRVGKMADEQDHHPKLITEWGRVEVVWWTHKIGGLHRNDFIAAARTDALV